VKLLCHAGFYVEVLGLLQRLDVFVTEKRSNVQVSIKNSALTPLFLTKNAILLYALFV
jgi:hypothetical protein